MRGRKKKEVSFERVLSIRVTEKQKEIIEKNDWIKKELNKIVREYLNSYI